MSRIRVGSAITRSRAAILDRLVGQRAPEGGTPPPLSNDLPDVPALVHEAVGLRPY
jgi:hypothetical protein